MTVEPEPGEAVSCTFTNSQNPGSIEICKVTVTTSGANPTFEFDLTGPDGDLPVSTSLQDGECDLDELNLTAGSGYAVSEDAFAGWDTVVSCAGGAEDPGNIDLSAGEDVRCTFTNTQLPPPPPVDIPVPVPVNNVWALLLLTLMVLATGWYFRPARLRRF